MSARFNRLLSVGMISHVLAQPLLYRRSRSNRINRGGGERGVLANTLITFNSITNVFSVTFYLLLYSNCFVFV